MGRAMDALMQQLGYAQYGAQGGDWGAIICQTLATQYPRRCVALHVNMAVTMQPHDLPGKLLMLGRIPFLGSRDRRRLWATMYFLMYETAYQAAQGTKPETLAVGLNDSPAGLLCWMLEKVHTWSDCHRGGEALAAGQREWERAVPRDALLLNLMVYWLSQSTSSSLRLYYEALRRHPHSHEWLAWDSLLASADYCPVPTGVLCGATEILQPPRGWAELSFNLTHWHDSQCKGGHFLAWENPDAVAADVRQFFHGGANFHRGVKLAPSRGARRPNAAMQELLLFAMLVAVVAWWLFSEHVADVSTAVLALIGAA